MTRFDDGGTGVRFAQHVASIPVDGGEISVRFSAAGAPTSVLGHWLAPQVTLPEPRVTEGAAKDMALNAYRTAFPSVDMSLVSIDDAAPASIRSTDEGDTHVVRTVQVTVAGAPSKDMGYLVDASDGAVVASWPLLATDSVVSGEGPGVASFDYARGTAIYNAADLKMFPVTQLSTPADGRRYEMRVDAVENGTPAITVVEGQLGTRVGANTANGPWEPSGAAGRGAAADAYFNVTRTVQFYREVLGWRSFDGRGARVRVVVHHPESGCNAGWHTTRNELYFGDGDPAMRCFPLGGMLDTVAHELTHGVFRSRGRTQTTLSIRGVNEGFADVMGAIVEHHYDPHPARNAAHAEAGYNGPAMTPVRDMADPSRGRAGTNISHADQVGECGLSPHCISNLISHAFHLMTVGGTNRVSNVSVGDPIGWDKARAIWWEVLRTATISDGGSAFRDVARATVAAAKAQSVSVAPVACAWKAVGIFSDEDVRGLRVVCATGMTALDGEAAVDGGVAPRLDSGTVERVDGGDTGRDAGGPPSGTDAGGVSGDDAGLPEGDDAGASLPGDDAGSERDICFGMPDGTYCNGPTPPPGGYPYGGYRCVDGALWPVFYGCPDGETCTGVSDGNIVCM